MLSSLLAEIDYFAYLISKRENRDDVVIGYYRDALSKLIKTVRDYNRWIGLNTRDFGYYNTLFRKWEFEKHKPDAKKREWRA